MNSKYAAHFKKLFCLLAALILVLVIPQSAVGNEKLSVSDQLIRVLLTRLELTDRMDVTLTAPYTLISEKNEQIHLQSGSQVCFFVRDDSIVMRYQGLSIKIGNALDLLRSPGDNEYTGFQMTNFPALYLGDLSLIAEHGTLRPILTIHVEDYLLGVVPYEMSDSFPLEALKAQAVAARTYALRCKNQYEDFDLYDNTKDQVFKGYLSGNSNAEAAIAETRGICGSYKGKLAQCFYAASNGGQTERVETVWPSKALELSYYSFGEDPYDVENPESIVRSFHILKEYAAGSSPYLLRKLIAENARNELASLGCSAEADDIHVDSVYSVSVDTPNMAGSKLMTRLHIEAEISVRDVSLNIEDTDLEEVSLFSDPYTAGFGSTITPSTVPEKEEKFIKLSQPLQLDLDIFPYAEEMLGMDVISNYENEIWTVTENEQSFVIEARRYGHGVGMSQRGAQWMAKAYGKNFQEILAFYYPGMELTQLPVQNRRFYKAADELSAEIGPSLTPTPRPTLMPVSFHPDEGQWLASVTEIAHDSSLNLRAQPSMNADILMRLYWGQKLLILERCPEDGWVHVKTDVVDGYVMEKYLAAE